MIYSTDRILTTHAGSLPRPADLRDMVLAKSRGEAVDQAALDKRLQSAVAEVVRRRSNAGSTASMTASCRNRISPIMCGRGSADLSRAPPAPGAGSRSPRATRPSSPSISRPIRAPASPARRPSRSASKSCAISARPISRSDIDTFKAALGGVTVAEAFLPANTPGTIEHWMANEHYKSDEEFVFAIADVMHEEYQAIVDAGLQLQIDDPDLPDGWNCLPAMSVPDYRKYAGMRVDALNHALRGIAKEKVRLHVCWGSFHGPHHDDIPLKDIVDLILRVNAGSFSIEASNPCHEHEWRVFETVKLPPGATLVPGVIGHCTDFIEHPDLVAERLVRYAKLVGRENVLAGTDCGIGTRVGHASICWAKFEAMAEGARRATKILWGT